MDNGKRFTIAKSLIKKIIISISVILFIIGFIIMIPVFGKKIDYVSRGYINSEKIQQVEAWARVNPKKGFKIVKVSLTINIYYTYSSDKYAPHYTIDLEAEGENAEKQLTHIFNNASPATGIEVIIHNYKAEGYIKYLLPSFFLIIIGVGLLAFALIKIED